MNLLEIWMLDNDNFLIAAIIIFIAVVAWAARPEEHPLPDNNIINGQDEPLHCNEGIMDEVMKPKKDDVNVVEEFEADEKAIEERMKKMELMYLKYNNGWKLVELYRPIEEFS